MKNKKIGYVLFLLITFDCNALVHESHLSSSWYKSDKTALQKQIRNIGVIAKNKFSPQKLNGSVSSIIVPHAGYKNSGHVASSAYQSLKKDSIKRVVILAPSHFISFHGVALPTYTTYKTPLGSIDVDTQVVKNLSSQPSFHYYASAHQPEHAVEIQIPFIQTYLNDDVSIVPLIVGGITKENAYEIADVLKKYLDDETLLVISSDFTHYGKQFGYVPFIDSINAKIYDLDSSILATIQNQKLDDFYDVIHSTGATVCGKNAIAIFLALMNDAIFNDVDSYLMGYDTSAAGVINPENSVSYVSLVFEQRRKKDPYLTKYEKSQLLHIARTTIEDSFESNKQEQSFIISQGMMQSVGAFVSLYVMGHHGKNLQGCMGTVESSDKLYETVKSMAKKAAFDDYRFSSIQERDIDYLVVGISVLQKPYMISNYRDIVIGRDGVILSVEDKLALFLPRIAKDFGWNHEELLSQLSKKAGLRDNAWKRKDAQIFVFQSMDFEEE